VFFKKQGSDATITVDDNMKRQLDFEQDAAALSEVVKKRFRDFENAVDLLEGGCFCSPQNLEQATDKDLNDLMDLSKGKFTSPNPNPKSTWEDNDDGKKMVLHANSASPLWEPALLLKIKDGQPTQPGCKDKMPTQCMPSLTVKPSYLL